MIAYPVGMHNDHFHDGLESLENKLSIILYEVTTQISGEGGTIVGNMYVYALLDWGHT